jgi:transitional endoplasmic reticulum ATPase
MSAPMKLSRLQRESVRPVRAPVELTPSQLLAMDRLEALAAKSFNVALMSRGGLGKTMIVEAFAARHDARIIGLADVIDFIAPLGETGYDSALLDWMRDELRGNRTLILDGLLPFFIHSYRSAFGYALEALYRDAEQLGHTVIVTGASPNHEQTTHHVFRRADIPAVEIPLFTHADYAALARATMGAEKADAIDFNKVFRFASLLNGHDLRAVAGIVGEEAHPTTEDFMKAIETFVVAANTNIHEVEDVRFETMPGTAHIARALETHIVTPLTRLDLAEELDLKPKRGVLLYGPPGTGKTSVGRALAHRLKGRFFLIDGSVKTEPAYGFLSHIQAIVHEAIENAPSVVFIDDADLLFGIGHVAGLTRYLLTLLDGLAGVNAGRVCVMMTAMDAGKIPEAILRSGRVELWLETRLPDPTARAGIIKRWLGETIPLFETVDAARLATLTDGFTPADLRRVAGDAKSLYAADVVAQRPIASATHYGEQAIADLLEGRNAMARNLADPAMRLG